MPVDLFGEQPPAPVQCIECDRFRLRDAGPMAQFGFGWCVLMKDKTRYPSATRPRECETFVLANEGTAASRRSWLAKQELKRNETE